MESLLVVSFLLIGIGFSLWWAAKYKNYGIIPNEKTVFKFLLGWIIFGFLARLDYTDQWGCVIGFEPIFESRNVLFSTISFGLIFWAFQTGNQRLKKILCLSELTYWVLKLAMFKGGYAVGFGGAPDITIVFYDLVSITARLFILNRILEIERNSFIKIGIFALIILGIKISLFATPMYTIYQESQIDHKTEESRKELIGKWSGKVKKLKEGEIKFEKATIIQIDSVSIYFVNISALENKYQLTLEYPDFGFLSKEVKNHDFSLLIEKLDQDLLVMTINDFMEGYEFRLKKEE